jgi:hypothetical protein
VPTRAGQEPIDGQLLHRVGSAQHRLRRVDLDRRGRHRRIGPGRPGQDRPRDQDPRQDPRRSTPSRPRRSVR